MGEERRLLLAGEGGEPVPEIGLVLGQPLFPGLVARVDRLGCGRVLQPLACTGKLALRTDASIAVP